MSDTQRLLDLELPRNDADAPTVRAYLIKLLAMVWEEEEGFNGKRPFGNSGWQYEIYDAMAKAGFVESDEDGILWAERDKAEKLILAAIESLT